MSDLRQRLTERLDTEPHLTTTDVVTTVMAVVRDELAAKDAEIEALKAGMASTASDALEHRLCGLDRARMIRRAELAEAENGNLRRRLSELRAYHQQIGDLP